MFKINEDKDKITFCISSEMRLVDRVIQECMEYLKQYNVSGYSNFKLALRELLINAIEHGNKNIPECIVTCSIEHLSNGRFKWIIEDQGKGFDYNAIDMRLPENTKQVRNRGYALINAFVDQLEFNEKGNQVTAYISIVPETEFPIHDAHGWKVVQATGDITASSADKLRILLLDMLKQGHKQYRFDLNKINDIDSVSLSVFICFANMLKQGDQTGLEVVNANKDIVNLFKMTRLDSIYKIVECGVME